ncbi:hypothetical protein [Amycolatopsis sp. MtRt-6]|uniref:hypothetical protein n=1 Tax=Amycolatopsis sp. MtRt-6 TaxID=2792782 RepID=UPI001F5C92D3|nr:hypothetical protein [Amycolatopsis sp. MtRt-6]
MPGRPDEDIAATQRVEAVWQEGVRADLAGYLGSADEQAGLAALRAQTEKVIAAVRDRLGIEL